MVEAKKEEGSDMIRKNKKTIKWLFLVLENLSIIKIKLVKVTEITSDLTIE